ncbi:MAG TPA: hypothetical protein VGZ47_19335 [Gemmataceae bacterium]|nr:hypothetical protein [Gemmataceae bacterium]
MSRHVLFCFPLFAFAIPAVAQQPPVEMLVRLNMQPMPAPMPALRYLLLPELKEMEPGNPIPNYLKCVLEAEASAEPDNLSKFALRQADRAARLDKPDWQILLKAKTEGAYLLLPDLQKMRMLAAALQMRFREEVSQRRFDDAIVTAKTMFAMSRHLGEHPTLIGDLVGIAVAAIAIGPLEEMLEQPGCPNLYWALTNLPHPFINLDLGLQGERLLIGAELQDLDDQHPMSPEQVKKVLTRIDKLRDLERGNEKKQKTTRELLNEKAKEKGSLDAARQRLIESGFPEERLKQFPVDQVLLLDGKLDYEVRRDEAMKLMNLPTWRIQEMLTTVEESQKKDKDKSLFYFLIPAIHKVRQAQGRLEQRLALLRTVEAIRMYAAEHNGKLPPKLSDIFVPVPDDPITGKPFRYQLDGETAHLRGTPPKGSENIAPFNMHYEITVQK